MKKKILIISSVCSLVLTIGTVLFIWLESPVHNNKQKSFTNTDDAYKSYRSDVGPLIIVSPLNSDFKEPTNTKEIETVELLELEYGARTILDTVSIYKNRESYFKQWLIIDDKKLQFLWDNHAKNNGFKNYSDFKMLMSNESARKVYFDNSNKDLGFKDFEYFESTLGVRNKNGSPSQVQDNQERNERDIEKYVKVVINGNLKPKEQYLFEDSLLSKGYHQGYLQPEPFFSDTKKIIHNSSIVFRFDKYSATVEYKTFEISYEFNWVTFSLIMLTSFVCWLVLILIVLGLVKLFRYLLNLYKSDKVRRRKISRISKVSFVVTIVLLMITNPSLKDFKEYIGYDNDDHGIARRESNFIIFSVYSIEYEETSPTYFYGVLANFFERD